MKFNKRILSLILLILTLIIALPTEWVYAGNNDSLPSDPSAGQGLNDWKFHPDWEGIRISLYWAPSLGHFVSGEDVVQIGETKDFTKTGPRYKIDEYTTYSIYRYMNGDNAGKGKDYNSELDKFNPYYYIGPEDSNVVANMPPVFNGTKKQWDNWIEGNNYKNIEEIARLLGHEITAEDFITGALDINGYKADGFYKLFIEPIIFPTVDDKGTVLTLRDAIRWEEAFNRGEIRPPQKVGPSGNYYTPSLTIELLPIFEYLANSQFLIEDEPAICMTANSTNYRVDGSVGAANTAEVRIQIQKGGIIYSSMGVGVFTSPKVEVVNNLKMLSVEIIDSSGNIVTEPLAGGSYKARYNIQYTGFDMTSYNNVYIDKIYIRNLKSGSKYYKTSPSKLSKSVMLKDGDTFYMETDYFSISEPSIYANGTIRKDDQWNKDTTDDYGEREIVGVTENLSLTIDSINPPVTKVYSPSTSVTQNYEILFTINYSTKNTATIPTKLSLSLKSNSYTTPKSLTKNFDINVSPGTNTLSVRTGDLVVKNSEGSFDLTLEVNKNRTSPPAESTYTDNKDTVTEYVQSMKTVADPCAGVINRENPSWTVTYNVSTATGYEKEVGYHGSHKRCVERSEPDENGKTKCIDYEWYDCTCSRCVGGSVDHWTRTSTRTEEFEITNIYFTSKDSGRVDLINKVGTIKAGYGFELDIVAKYTGSESPGRPSTWGGCNYQKVSPGAYSLNTLPNKIYVILPDGQILSNSSSTGIKNLMDCTVTNSSDTSKILKCSVKMDNTFGNKETRKLYVSETTRDGTYDITVCTAKFNGVSPNAVNHLFDRRKVSFKVQGKYTDDVTVHIVQ